MPFLPNLPTPGKKGTTIFPLSKTSKAYYKPCDHKTNSKLRTKLDKDTCIKHNHNYHLLFFICSWSLPYISSTETYDCMG